MAVGVIEAFRCMVRWRRIAQEETMVDANSSVTVQPAPRALSTAMLSAGFSLTGAGTVMLGVLLPTFSLRWGLRDDQAGLLLFLQFFASGLGAVFTGLHRVRSLAIGYALLATTLGLLAFNGSKIAYAAFFFYGLGLGMAMTSTSLLFSDRWGDDRAAKLEWLNFAWSAGATAGPLCFLPFLHQGNFRWLFVSMMMLSVAMLVWVVLLEHDSPRAGPKRKSGISRKLGSDGFCVAPAAGDDHRGGGDIAERMADDLFASRGDARPGRGGSRNFDLLAWRDAEPAGFFDAAAGQGGAAAGSAMGNLGRDGRGGRGNCSPTTVADPSGRGSGGHVYRPSLSAFAFVSA